VTVARLKRAIRSVATGAGGGDASRCRGAAAIEPAHLPNR
jgi:hypothetical protein